MIGGEDDPHALADEARGRLKKKPIPLRRALSGRVTAHHRLRLRLLMDQVGHLEALIARLDGRIAEVIGLLTPAVAQLETIPGRGPPR